MLPDKNGHFGQFGGRYAAETLMPAILELEEAFEDAHQDQHFALQVELTLRQYVGRPTPLYFAKRLTDWVGGAKIYLKREDLCHTGAHKINNAVGQVLLALRMGKKRLIAETGAGQHGVATATVAAQFGLDCEIFMGEEDIRRQSPNVERMKLLGASIVPVSSGTATLKDAMNEAMRDWVTHIENTFYLIGSVAGPHPYPLIVRHFQTVIGAETMTQIDEYEGRDPHCLIACVGGGSNAMGLFYPFIDKSNIELIGVEAAGLGLNTDKHSATLSKGRVGVLHGSKSYVLCNDDGQIDEVHSISAGLDYPGVGPEHSWLKESGRARYISATDEEALEAFNLLCRTEGIIPALESAHAVAAALVEARNRNRDDIIIVNLSGRGDKDLGILAGLAGDK